MIAIPFPADIAVSFAAGILVGLAHFGALRFNAALFAKGRVFHAMLLQIVRFAALAGVLVVVARTGAAALGTVLAGLLIGRFICLRRCGGAA